MRKLLFLLLSLVLIFISGFQASPPANAARYDCTVRADSVKDSEGKRDPVPADSDDKQIAVIIDSRGQIQEGEFKVRIDGGNTLTPYVKKTGNDTSPFIFKPEGTIEINGTTHQVMDNNGKITIPTLNRLRHMDGSDPNHGSKTWTVNDYRVRVYQPDDPQNKDPFCDAVFRIGPAGGGGEGDGSSSYCSINYLADNDYTIPETKVGIKINFTDPNDTDDNPEDTEDTHRHRVKIKSGLGENQDNTPTTTELKNGWPIPQKLNAATYMIEVREHARSNWGESEGRSCWTEWPFLIETEENGGGYVCSKSTTGCNYAGILENAPLSRPCSKDNYDENQGCLRIKTALGFVDTEASAFARWVLGFILSISGGIVLIIIIISGYRLMVSQGDPEKIKNARDQLTAAIVGLLFIIFSLVILQFITQDILQLPGFGQP